jgi:Tol biopolymer transport system component
MLGEKRLADDLDYVLGCAFTPSGKLLYAANRGGEFGNDDFGQMRLFPPRGGKWFIVMGDDQRDVPSGIDSPEWVPTTAPDGKTPVYVAKKGDRECVVVGDQPGPLFGGIGGMAFTSDGKSMAYIARLFGPREPYKEQRLVIDGKVGEERFLDMDLRVRMSPDGKVFALRTSGKDGMQVRIGAQTSDFYQIVDNDLIMSPDGRKVAFCARKGREIWWKVLEAK